MLIRLLIGVFCLAVLQSAAQADERTVRLYAPDALVETGVLKYVLPRFSLKTQVRVSLEDGPDAADLVLGDEGTPLVDGLGQTWAVVVQREGHLGTTRLTDWLFSDVGQRTFQSYAPDGVALFSAPTIIEEVVEVVISDAEAALGHEVALSKCTRCHQVDKDTVWSGIGSTPSFGGLRSMADWEERFSAFYVLKPHAAFMIIPDLTEPFPEDRPSPIVPIEMTIEEVDALMAYVTKMAPADLGAPLRHQ